MVIVVMAHTAARRRRRRGRRGRRPTAPLYAVMAATAGRRRRRALRVTVAVAVATARGRGARSSSCHLLSATDGGGLTWWRLTWPSSRGPHVIIVTGADGTVMMMMLGALMNGALVNDALVPLVQLQCPVQPP